MCNCGGAAWPPSAAMVITESICRVSLGARSAPAMILHASGFVIDRSKPGLDVSTQRPYVATLFSPRYPSIHVRVFNIRRGRSSKRSRSAVSIAKRRSR